MLKAFKKTAKKLKDRGPGGLVPFIKMGIPSLMTWTVELPCTVPGDFLDKNSNICVDMETNIGRVWA